MSKLRVLHNPRCSKSRGALALLDERGVDYDVVRYLEQPLDPQEIARLYALLGDTMVRRGEAVYKELGLKNASPEQLVEALAQHPILIERPLAITAERALVARPPERILELL